MLPFNDQELLLTISKYCRNKSIERDEVLLRPGDKILFIPIVQTGVLRVVREDDEGRDLFLYHLYPGQTCAMAINCCESGNNSMVKVIAEDNTEVVQIPVTLLNDLLKFNEWRSFISNTYSIRFAELLQVIDLIAFNQMDKQVLHYLTERAKANQTKALFITHQQIADELHTHREAISRLLRQMEQKNLLKLGRNSVELLID